MLLIKVLVTIVHIFLKFALELIHHILWRYIKACYSCTKLEGNLKTQGFLYVNLLFGVKKEAENKNVNKMRNVSLRNGWINYL